MNKSNRRAKYVRQDAAEKAGENTNQIRGVTPGRRMSSDPKRVEEIARQMIDDGDLPGWAVFEDRMRCCPSDVLVYDTIEDMQSGTYYAWGNDVAEQTVDTFENPNPITYFPQEGQMCIVPGPRGGIFRFVEEDSTDPDDHPLEDGGIVFGAGPLAEIEGNIQLWLQAPMDVGSDRGYWTSDFVRHYGTIGNKGNGTHYRHFPQEINWEIKDADGNVIHTAADFVNYVTENNQDLNRAHALVGEVPEGTYTLVMHNNTDGVSLPIECYSEDADGNCVDYEGGAEYFPNGMGWGEFVWNLFLDNKNATRVYPNNQAIVAAQLPENFAPQFIDENTGKRRNPLFSPGEGLSQEHTFEVKHKARRTGHNYYNAYWIREGTDQAKEWESRWWYDPDAEDDADHINQMFHSAVYKKYYEGGKEPNFAISPGDYTTLSPIHIPHGMRNWNRIQIHAWGSHINVRHWGAGITSRVDVSEVQSYNANLASQWGLMHNHATNNNFDIQGFDIRGFPTKTTEAGPETTSNPDKWYENLPYYEPLLTMSQYNLFEDWYNPYEEIETLWGATETDEDGNLIPLIATNDGYNVESVRDSLIAVATHYSSAMIEIVGGYNGSIQNCYLQYGATGIRTVLGLGWIIQNNLTNSHGFSHIEPQQGDRILVEPFPWISVGESGYQEFTEPVTSSTLRALGGTDADLNAPEYPLDTGEKYGETGRLWASDVDEQDPAYKLYEVRTEVTSQTRDVDEESGEIVETFEETVPAVQYIRSNLKNRENRQDSGCTDHIACNWDPNAPWDDAASHSDGTCIYPFAQDVIPLRGCYDCAGNMLWRRVGRGMSASNSQSNVASIKDNRGVSRDGQFTYIFSKSNGLLLNQNIAEGQRTYYGVWHTGGSNVRGIRSYSIWVEEANGPAIRGRLYAENNYHYFQRASQSPLTTTLVEQHVPPTDPMYGQYKYPSGTGTYSGDGWVYKVRGTDPISIEECYFQYSPRIIHSTSSLLDINRISWLANANPPYFGYKRPREIRNNTWYKRTNLGFASLNSAQQSFAPGGWPFYDEPITNGGTNGINYEGGTLNFFTDAIIDANRGVYFNVAKNDQINYRVKTNLNETEPEIIPHSNLEFSQSYQDISEYNYEGFYGLQGPSKLSRKEHFIPWRNANYKHHPYWADQEGVHDWTGAWTAYGLENDGLVWESVSTSLTWTIGNATLLGVKGVMGNLASNQYYAGYNIYSSAACQGTFKIMGGFGGPTKDIPADWEPYHGGDTTYDARQSAEIWMYESKANGNNYIKLKAQEDLASNFTITVPGITGTMMMNVVEDTAPQLGGPLDVNGQIITSASNGDITLDPDGTGSIIFKSDDIQFQTATAAIAGGDFRLYESSLLTPQNFIAIQAPASVTADTTLVLPDGAGSNGQVLSTNGSGTLSWLSVLTATNPTINNTLSLQSLDGVNAAQILIYDLDGSNYVRVGVNSNLTSNVDFILPTSNGSNGQVLATNGSGVLSYVDQTTDTNTNLGNSDLTLAAERTVEMGSNALVFENTSNVVAKIWPAGYVQGKGRLIVEGTSTIGGTVRFWDADSSHYIDVQAPATVSSNETFVLPAADGSAGEFLKTDGSGNLSFAAAGGSSVVTDPFNSTTIKVLPHQFQINDDAGRPLFVEDDTANTLGVRCFGSSDEMYAFVKLPSGYKATHVHVYASASTTNAATILSYNFTTGATNNVASTTINLNSNTAITEIAAASGQDLVIKVAPGANTTIIFGAAVTIATV